MHESENQKKPKIFCCAGYGSGPADDTSDTACGLPGKDTFTRDAEPEKNLIFLSFELLLWKRLLV